MAAVKVGQLVWANVGTKAEGGWGDFIGPVTKDTYTVDGEEKVKVQTPDGDDAVVGYREPGDRDAAGAGGTFWLI